jgi:hypothetical protein
MTNPIDLLFSIKHRSIILLAFLQKSTTAVTTLTTGRQDRRRDDGQLLDSTFCVR